MWHLLTQKHVNIKYIYIYKGLTDQTFARVIATLYKSACSRTVDS